MLQALIAPVAGAAGWLSAALTYADEHGIELRTEIRIGQPGLPVGRSRWSYNRRISWRALAPRLTGTGRLSWAEEGDSISYIPGAY
jgi:hypothetical protein